MKIKWEKIQASRKITKFFCLFWSNGMALFGFLAKRCSKTNENGKSTIPLQINSYRFVCYCSSLFCVITIQRRDQFNIYITHSICLYNNKTLCMCAVYVYCWVWKIDKRKKNICIFFSVLVNVHFLHHISFICFSKWEWWGLWTRGRIYIYNKCVCCCCVCVSHVESNISTTVQYRFNTKATENLILKFKLCYGVHDTYWQHLL